VQLIDVDRRGLERRSRLGVIARRHLEGLARGATKALLAALWVAWAYFSLAQSTAVGQSAPSPRVTPVGQLPQMDNRARAAIPTRKPYLRIERVQDCLKARGLYVGTVNGETSVPTSRAVHKLLIERDPVLQRSLSPPARKSPELLDSRVQARLGEACRQVLIEVDEKRARDPEERCGTASSYSGFRKGCVCASDHERVAGVCMPRVGGRAGVALSAAASVAAPAAPFAAKPVTMAASQQSLPAAKNSGLEAQTADLPQISCLPAEMKTLLARRAGPKPSVPTCALPCLAQPPGLRLEDLRQYEEQSGVTWCTNCVAFGSYLALEDIDRIERAGNLSLCRQASRSALPVDTARSPDGGRAFKGPRALFARRPAAVPHGNIAVIVTMSRYRPGLLGSAHAIRDGMAMRALLTERLGYQGDNVIEVKEPTQNDLIRLFGAGGTAAPAAQPATGGPVGATLKGEVWGRFNNRGTAPGATLLVYISGLGTFRAADTGAHLLAVDAEPGREEASGFPLSRLIDSVGRLGLPLATLLLEVDFSRNGGQMIVAPNAPEAADRFLPADPKGAVTLITAADRDQRTLEDPEYGIGLFTRHLITGLSGGADLAPIGNGDNAIDAIELHVHAAYRVEMAARRSFGVMQKPTLFRPHNQPVVRLGDIVN
jgi:hypothetical protein